MTWPAKVRKLVAVRAGGICEGCGVVSAAELHHRKYRSRGGLDTPSNALFLCGWGNHTGCHGIAHSQPGHDRGWSVNSWGDPLTERVLRRGLWVLLDDVGEFTPVVELREAS